MKDKTSCPKCGTLMNIMEDGAWFCISCKNVVGRPRQYNDNKNSEDIMSIFGNIFKD